MNTKENSESWNQIIYFVSDVYSITRKFPVGYPENLGMRMRRAAVAVSAGFNSYQEKIILQKKQELLYPLLSSIAILETYLVMAKNQCLGVDLDGIDEKLQKLKEGVKRLIDGESVDPAP